MKLKLNSKELFWALMDPKDLNAVIVLNGSNPAEEIDYDKLPTWAKKQIMSSAQSKMISTDPELKSDVVEKVTKKTSKVAKKATSKN